MSIKEMQDVITLLEKVKYLSILKNEFIKVGKRILEAADQKDNAVNEVFSRMHELREVIDKMEEKL